MTSQLDMTSPSSPRDSQAWRRLRPLLLLLLLAGSFVLSSCEWLQNEFIYISSSGEELEELFEQQGKF